VKSVTAIDEPERSVRTEDHSAGDVLPCGMPGRRATALACAQLVANGMSRASESTRSMCSAWTAQFRVGLTYQVSAAGEARQLQAVVGRRPSIEGFSIGDIAPHGNWRQLHVSNQREAASTRGRPKRSAPDPLEERCESNCLSSPGCHEERPGPIR
jgi:hypothetical protein